MSNYDTLEEVFAGLDRLTDQFGTVGAAPEKYATLKGLTPSDSGLLSRLATILVDYHH